MIKYLIIELPVFSLNSKWKQTFIRQEFAGMKQRFQPILPHKNHHMQIYINWA